MLLNFIQTLKLGFELKKSISKQAIFAGKFTHLLDENFPEKNRIQKYAIYIPAFITFAYSKLNSSAFSSTEQHAITALGALTALFDDLFDTYQYSDDFILNIICNPQNESKPAPEIKLLLSLYEIFEQNSVHGQSTDMLISKVAESQINSRRQISDNISIDELKQITSDKGGFAMQLYRRAFQAPISPEEDALYYAIGAIGQLENDIFDVYIDTQCEIKTLANSELTLNELELHYLFLENKIFENLQKTGFSTIQKHEFTLVVKLITARAKVAINQYKHLIKADESMSKLTKFTRKELICDMEKPSNLLKLLHYTVG